MRRKEIDSDVVADLYREGMSVRAIAVRYGCSDGPIYRSLLEAGVKVSRHALIDPDELRRLYLEERQPLSAVARHYRVAPSTIRTHLAMAGIRTRTHAESLQPKGRKPCPKSLTYRSYALGFVWGDLAAERLGPTSETIAVRGSTTRNEQLHVIEEVFGAFGKVTVSRGGRSMCVRASLDLSFEFLLDKYGTEVPIWIRGSAPEAAFAAGYIDAEGSFGVYDGRGRFKLDSYDEVVHRWLDGWMARSGIRHVTRALAKAADLGEPEAARLWRTNVNEALSLCRMIATIEPFARHGRRRETMDAVTENVRRRLRSRDSTLEPPQHRDHQPC